MHVFVGFQHMSRTLLHTVSESKFQEKSGLARVHPDNLSDLLSYYKKTRGKSAQQYSFDVRGHKFSI
jgi:hypothetical protein